MHIWFEIFFVVSSFSHLGYRQRTSSQLDNNNSFEHIFLLKSKSKEIEGPDFESRTTIIKGQGPYC